MAIKLEAVPVREARPLREGLASDQKFYNIGLQLGSKRRWKQFGGGRWKEDPANNPIEGGKAYKHVHAVHKVGPLTGDQVNALILKHNAFLNANHENKSPEGDVSRTILVLGMEETKPPVLKSIGFPFDIEQLVAKVAEGAATAAVAAVMGVGVKKT